MSANNESTPSDSFTEALSQAAELLSRFAIPIYKIIRGEPVQHGTGFFVRIEGKNFLVSAAHVLEVLRTTDLHIYIAPDTLLKLTGKLVLTQHLGPRQDDRIDVGVLRLEGDSQPPFVEVNKFAMDGSYLQPSFRPRGGRIYALIGFPSSKSRINPKSGQAVVVPYAYTTPSSPEELYAKHGYASETHILLPMNTKRGFGLDGQPRSLPDPHGMSGSPIVVLYNENGTKDARAFPVVGVATTFYKREHLIVATDAKAILEHIAIAASAP